jgi:hypothetical protein
MMCIWMNASLADLLDQIERIVRVYDADTADEMRNDLEAVPLPSGDKLNLRQELANFSGPMTLSLEVQTPFAPDAARLLLAYGHRERDATNRLLSTLTGLLPMTERDSSGGERIYDAPFGGVSLAAASGFLLAGTTAAVEAGLRSSGADAGLGSDPAFRRAAEFVPREAWGVMYADSRRMWEASLEFARNQDAIRSSAMTNPVLAVVSEVLTSMTTSMNKERLSDASALLAYQAVGLMAFSTHPDGIRFTQVQMLPGE